MEGDPQITTPISLESVFKLKEHEAFSGDVRTYIEGLNLDFRITDYESAPRYLGISPDLEASYFIGADWLTDDKAIVITPKIGDIDFLKMFVSALRFSSAASYFPKFYGIDFNAPRIESETLDNILTPLLMIHYLNTVKCLISKGLKKGYVSREENMSSKIKGKVMMSKHFSKNVTVQRSDRVFCTYQDYSSDIPENRLLKRALLYVQRCFNSWSAIRNHSLHTSLSTTVSEALAVFCNVSDQVDISSVRFVQKNKLYGDYGTAIRLAKMVLRRFDYSITNTSSSKHLIPPFWIDMSRLFEVYVYGLLEKAYPNQICFQVKGHMDTQADFLKLDEKLILDTKYKPQYAYSNAGMIWDIREISGYARDEAILTRLGVQSIDTVPDCVIIHPAYTDQEEANNAPFSTNILATAKPISGFRKFHKIQVPIPRIH